MDINNFSKQVANLSQRLAALMKTETALSSSIYGSVSGVFKELGFAIEELEVAVEEINRQNEELAIAVEAANLERRRYKHLFRFAPQAHLITNLRGEIEEANLMASELLGVPFEFLMRKPLVIYVHSADRALFRAELNRRQERDYYQDWELRLDSRNPHSTHVECSTVALRDRTGEPVGFQWTLRDISDRKRLEKLEQNGYGESEPHVDWLQHWPLSSFSKGDIIALSTQSIGYVQSGLVKLTTLTEQNKEVLLGMLGPGSSFGASLTALPLHEATALTDVQLITVSIDEALNSAQLARHLMLSMKRRIQQSEALLAISGETSTEKRLCLLLDFLKQEIGHSVEQGIRLNLRLTHADLVSACCTTRVTITRLLGKLQQSNKIAFDEESHIIFVGPENCTFTSIEPVMPPLTEESIQAVQTAFESTDG